VLVALLKRVIGGIVVTWGAVTLLFLAFWVLPGDRVDAVLASDRFLTDDVRDRTMERLGLDEPLLVQYGRYWESIAHGDFGNSFVTGREVRDIITSTAPASLRLAFWAVLIELIVGVLLARFMFRRNRALRMPIGVVTLLALSVPVFVVGLVLQLALGVFPAEHNWPAWLRFPVQGIGPDEWILGVIPSGDQWRSLVLPAVTLAAASTAIAYRLTMSSLRSVSTEPHVNGARARGLSERLVFRRHIARNATIPAITFVGLDLANLFGAAVITESVFNWPGVGSEVATALERQDTPVILGFTIVLCGVYLLVNIAVDVLYRLLDPRLRERDA
jgi:ABC-type dipeptide/oligopeptide/nickel transport system permease component